LTVSYCRNPAKGISSFDTSIGKHPDKATLPKQKYSVYPLALLYANRNKYLVKRNWWRRSLWI